MTKTSKVTKVRQRKKSPFSDELLDQIFSQRKGHDAVIVRLDTESRQIVTAPKNRDRFQEQYFAKASVVAKASKAEDRW
jgi:hypothetical protein